MRSVCSGADNNLFMFAIQCIIIPTSVPPMGSGGQATTFGETISLDDYMKQMHQIENKFTRKTTKESVRALSRSDADDTTRVKDWQIFESHRFFIASNQYDVKDKMRR